MPPIRTILKEEYDYIVVGAGLSGCVFASRLAELNPDSTVLLIDGKQYIKHFSALTSAYLDCYTSYKADETNLDPYARTSPQHLLDGRRCLTICGKTVVGYNQVPRASAKEFWTWNKGNPADYDRWSKIVDDKQWSYDNLVEYLETAESHFKPIPGSSLRAARTPSINPWNSSSKVMPPFLFKQVLRAAWARFGASETADARHSEMYDFNEKRRGQKTDWGGSVGLVCDEYLQPSRPNLTHSGSRVVEHVNLVDRGEMKVATGVTFTQYGVLSSVRANKEVILSAGAYRTPQILLLSGIGPKSELEVLNIRSRVYLPNVGRNLHDHFALCQWWKLRDHDPRAIGGELLEGKTSRKSAFSIPCDWIVTGRTPQVLMEEALNSDAPNKTYDVRDLDAVRYLDPKLCNTETIIYYLPVGAKIAGVDIPRDGTHIASVVINTCPTSRGSVILSSDSAAEAPVINPRYYTTEVDRVAMRHAVRQVTKVLRATHEGSIIIECEVPPPDCPPEFGQLLPGLFEGPNNTTVSEPTESRIMAIRPLEDSEIDNRVRRVGNTFYNPGGTAAMGEVVDTNMCVYGVEGLRVIDASIFPIPLAAQYQVTLYAIALKAAEMVTKAGSKDPDATTVMEPDTTTGIDLLDQDAVDKMIEAHVLAHRDDPKHSITFTNKELGLE